MKSKFFSIIVVVAFVSLSGYGVYKNQQKNVLSDVMLANLEALADIESSGTDKYDISKQETNHTMNGEIYKQSMVIDCYEGGPFECTSGKYYRYKLSNGEWSAWIPN